MSKPPDAVVELSETLTLCEYQNPKSGHFGYWLYDKTRSMNLAMRAKTEREAFVIALQYYQKRLATVERDHTDLTQKVEAFVELFAERKD